MHKTSISCDILITIHSSARNNIEFRQAFHLFDQDKDGLITTEELIKLIDKVGGCMTEGEARGLIRQADKDKNGGIDLSEFGILWAAMKGEGEVGEVVDNYDDDKAEFQEDIKEEFARLDTDSSGFITKGMDNTCMQK